jgi:demethylmenaquinone methyltransferase / 2-methoxy-6-polyprenyl-1,4-benzoquinol methylase
MADLGAEIPVWKAKGAEKTRRVREMFAEIAPTYDLLNDLISLRGHHGWRARAVRGLQLRPGAKVLDVCSGTGEFVRSIRRAMGPSVNVVGVDFALPMLEAAVRKPGANALYVVGDALTLPVPGDCFDGATVGWGIRNVSDIDAAHVEIFRVLKHGGRFASVDMAVPPNRVVRAVTNWVFGTFVPLLGRLFGKGAAYAYLHRSVGEFWSRAQLEASMGNAGFVQVRHQDLLFGNVCIFEGVKP